MVFRSRRIISLILTNSLWVAILAGCNENEDSTEISVPKDVIISTTDDKYTSSAISILGKESPYPAVNSLFPTVSDADIFTQGNFLYRVERSNRDNISKYDISTLRTNSSPLWQFSTRAPDETTSNVHDMVFASATKAYLLRYARKNAWIIDPSATSETKFRTGSLDFTDYADADGSPEMDRGVIVNGKLFVVLQRLENWVAKDAYVAVIDTTTDLEINTGNNADHKGIRLPVQDPENIHYNAETGKLYVSAVGSYDLTDSSISGLVEIDPETYAVRTVLNPASPISGSPAYKRISGAVVISATNGYFTDYSGWKDNALYMFNPTTGLVNPTPVAGLEHKNLANLAYNATSGLWLGEHTEHSVMVIDPLTNTISATIKTVLNPGTIRFIEN